MTAATAPTADAPTGAVQHFERRLALIALGALLVSVAAALYFDRYTDITGDAVWYSGNAVALVDGHGYIAPLSPVAVGHLMPSAAHPPLYPLWLAVPGVVDQDLIYQRLWSGLVLVATVVLLGLLGRDLAGERTGLLAALLGAVSVSLVAQNATLWSEGLFAFTIVLTVWLSYRFIRRPGLLNAGLLSAAITLAALTRAEGALLYLILLVPLALRARSLELRRRVACIAVAAGVALVLMSPWLIYNNVGRFERPVGLSTGLGGLIGSSNCPNTYDGKDVGGWGGICAQGVTVTIAEDETLQDEKLLDAGLQYASDHTGRLLAVIPFRVLRSFGFYHPFRVTERDLGFAADDAEIGAWAATFQYWVYLALGIAGLAALRRRRIALLPFLAPVVTVVVITVFGYGTMRFRVALDAILPVLAAIGAVALWCRARRRAEPRTATTGAHARRGRGPT